MGFDGGNILEPALGTGNFLGKMPESTYKESRIYGTEIDSISGRIAKRLYPDADISITCLLYTSNAYFAMYTSLPAVISL